MNTPKFKVGEEVILQSISCPQFNGDHVVKAILEDGERHFCRTGDNTVVISDGLTYLLEEILVHEHGNRIFESLWCESALRKKYPPSTKSFNELMDELKEFEC